LWSAVAALEHRLAVGRLHLRHREVYAVGHTALRREGRWSAAALASGEGAVLSHRSAAAHWGLLATSQARVDVTAARGRRGASGIRLHRSRFLNARDSTSHDGIPITTIARTLLDLAATVRVDRLDRALAQAMHLQLYDHAAITDVIARSNGHRRTATLTHATAREPKVTRSDWEIRMLKLIRDAGLPEPLVNFSLDARDHGQTRRRHAASVGARG
jgi:predicted transcriptional regulator of viral defense system